MECKECHTDKPEADFRVNWSRGKRYVCRTCKECAAQWQRDHRAAHPEKLREYRKNTVELRRNAVLKYRYGISNEQYDEMLLKQEGKCAICGSTDPGAGKKHFSVDHNHVTGKVRSLLCNDCNNGLGKFKDSPALMEQAAAYVRAHDEEAHDAVA